MNVNSVLYAIDPATKNIYPVTIDPTGHIQIDALSSNEYSWVNGAWHKNPIRLGYSNTVFEQKTAVAVAGGNYVYSTVCPANKVWEVQLIAGLNTTTAVNMYLGVSNGVFGLNFDYKVAVPIGTPSAWHGKFHIPTGLYIYAYFFGCIAGDNLYLQYLIKESDINQ